MLKSPKQLSNCLKIALKGAVLIIFHDVFCAVRAYTAAVSYRRSTRIGYQKSHVLVSDQT